MTLPLPEIRVGRLLSYNERGRFYIIFDGKQRYFANRKHFPNGLPPDELVSFTIAPPTGKGRLPELDQVLFQKPNPEPEKT
jgi:hypothetical protein